MNLPAGQALQLRHFPETQVGGFSKVDGSIDFWSRIHALIAPEWSVLDYGAGRGAYIATDVSPYRRQLKTLKGRVRHVAGCDVDPAVMDNPFLDEAQVITPGAPLPFADASFDLVYANWVFEHVTTPQAVVDELLRVTKPGGWIAAATANKWGYVAIASSLVPNRHHVAAKSKISPDVADVDVFPTAYLMNTPGTLRALFGSRARLWCYTQSAEPSYHFNNSLAYGLFKALHKLLPDALGTGLYMFARKHGDAPAPDATAPP